MIKSRSNEVIGIHVPSHQDEQFVKNEIEKTKLLSELEKETKKSFIETIISQGQAAEIGGNVYLKTTHQIVGYEPDGLPVLKRLRF